MTGAPVKHDAETLQERILTFRDQKVILDADLALLYGVPTKALNQAVKRNMARFPADPRTTPLFDLACGRGTV